MKTATLERSIVRGKMYYQQTLLYRDAVLVDAICYGQETITGMIESARRQGFTHVRFFGDWSKLTVPKRIRTDKPYAYKLPSIEQILQRAGVKA